MASLGDAFRTFIGPGVNPISEKRRDRREASSKTFQALSDRYMEEHARRFKRSADADERNLRLHVLPKWAKRRYDHIRRSDVIELVEGMVKAGSPVQANRVQALISMIFSFAVDSDLMDANPCSRLRKRGAENQETRVLSDDEIRQFWRRGVLPPVTRRVGLALRLTLLTGCRPGEAAGIDRKELSDLDVAGKAVWLLPPERSKNGRAHLVPLSELARSTVLSAIDLISDEDEYLFPSPVEAGGPITGHALTVAMSRMGKKIEGAAVTTWSVDPPSPHDLRRTVATRLSALGISKEDRDACFNHTPTDVGSRHYDQYERAAEKRQALELWARQLEALLKKPLSC